VAQELIQQGECEGLEKGQNPCPKVLLVMVKSIPSVRMADVIEILKLLYMVALVS
jgi:hypothetical protein